MRGEGEGEGSVELKSLKNKKELCDRRDRFWVRVRVSARARVRECVREGEGSAVRSVYLVETRKGLDFVLKKGWCSLKVNIACG